MKIDIETTQSVETSAAKAPSFFGVVKFAATFLAIVGVAYDRSSHGHVLAEQNLLLEKLEGQLADVNAGVDSAAFDGIFKPFNSGEKNRKLQDPAFCEDGEDGLTVPEGPFTLSTDPENDADPDNDDLTPVGDWFEAVTRLINEYFCEQVPDLVMNDFTDEVNALTEDAKAVEAGAVCVDEKADAAFDAMRAEEGVYVEGFENDAGEPGCPGLVE